MFYGEFKNKNDVERDFATTIDGVIVFAAYECADYCGQADVIFVHDAKLYHVSGSHCSCFGLENQFQPEEMPLAALRLMSEKGDGQLGLYRRELKPVFDYLESINIDTADKGVLAVLIKLAYS